jgi:hypothetical protein
MCCHCCCCTHVSVPLRTSFHDRTTQPSPSTANWRDAGGGSTGNPTPHVCSSAACAQPMRAPALLPICMQLLHAPLHSPAANYTPDQTPTQLAGTGVMCGASSGSTPLCVNSTLPHTRYLAGEHHSSHCDYQTSSLRKGTPPRCSEVWAYVLQSIAHTTGTHAGVRLATTNSAMHAYFAPHCCAAGRLAPQATPTSQPTDGHPGSRAISQSPAVLSYGARMLPPAPLHRPHTGGVFGNCLKYKQPTKYVQCSEATLTTQQGRAPRKPTNHPHHRQATYVLCCSSTRCVMTDTRREQSKHPV